MKPDRPTRRAALQAALAAAVALLPRRRAAAAPRPKKPRKPIRWIGHG
jgi:hypothetical protein